MNRRSLLGFLGGAVASGPTLAKGIAADVSGSAWTAQSAAYGVSAESVSGDYRVTKIARLKRFLSGELDDDEKRHHRVSALHSIEDIERFRLDGLRSIAPAHKLRMLQAGNQGRRDLIERIHAEGELERLLRLTSN